MNINYWKILLICSRRPFMFEDDSDEDEKRVVRAQKDKRY